MQYLRRGSSQGVQRPQQHHLEDLEEILNTPSPALNHEVSSSVFLEGQPVPVIQRSSSEPNLLSHAASALSSVQQPAAAISLDKQVAGSQQAAEHILQDAAAPDSRSSRLQQQLLAWQSSAYETTVAPLAAIRSRMKGEHQTQAQGSHGSWLTARPQLPNLMEHLVNNRSAAIAASVAGGAAGGAIAGPLGVAAGAKTGAFMIAVGAAAAGAAQQYYLPVKPADAKPAAS